jgi:hypothetical protein
MIVVDQHLLRRCNAIRLINPQFETLLMIFQVGQNHIDRTVFEITMTLPRYSGWVEFLEDGQNAVREYVYQLTRHWIQISHFSIETGTITSNGTIASCFSPLRFDIPLGKFYKPMIPSAWVTDDQHPHHPKYNQKGLSKSLSTLMAIASNRKDVVYHQVELIPFFVMFHSKVNRLTLKKMIFL